MHMYEYLLFELKSEWVSQELWHTGRRSTSSSKNSCQGKEGLFFQGTVGTRQIGKFWKKHRNLSYFGQNTNIYIYMNTYIYIYIFQYMCGNKGTKCNNVYIYIFILYI